MAGEGPMSLSPPPEIKSCVRPCLQCNVYTYIICN